MRIAHRLRLEITVTDRKGRFFSARSIDRDILLRNWLSYVKSGCFNTILIAADTLQDVTNVNRTSFGVVGIQKQMTGTGVTAETSSDFRIQTPLYTTPDAMSVGTVSLGGGNQIVLALTAAHTFAAGATVTEAGIANCNGSTATYLTANNFQLTRNTFAGVVVPLGGTFTGTYTLTGN